MPGHGCEASQPNGNDNKSSSINERKNVKIPSKKKCRVCGKTKTVTLKKLRRNGKPKTNFWKLASSPDGLRDECNECFNDARKRRKAAKLCAPS